MSQFGIGGIIVILVIKEVFAFLKTKKPGNVDKMISIKESLKRIEDRTDAIYEMHNQKDSDGVYIWYVRRSLEEAVNKLAENIQHQTDIFKELVMDLKNRTQK